MTHALGKPDLEANLRLIVSVTIAAWLAAAGAALAAPSGGQQQKHHWSKMSVSQIIAVQRRSIRQDWKVITTWQQSRWRVLARGADITVMAADMKTLMIPPPANVRWHEEHMRWTKRELKENLRALARQGREHARAPSAGGAGLPPHYSELMCIHRYEGSWTDSGAPFWGGLQMNYDFMQAYGAELLRTKGTADHWTPLEQMWVAEQAIATRGFAPWPNTARYCGLL